MIEESKKEFLSSVEILILSKPFVLYAKYPRNKFYSIHHAIYPFDVKDKQYKFKLKYEWSVRRILRMKKKNFYTIDIIVNY